MSKRCMVKGLRMWLLCMLVTGGGLGAVDDKDAGLLFANPPLCHAPRPLWFWNNTQVSAEELVGQMQLARDRCGYGGFGILPFGEAFRPVYLSEDYFQVYGAALDKARALGMKMCLYDEYGFPSGSAGAMHGDGVPRFANRHPEDTIKRLDRHEQVIDGPQLCSMSVPNGKLMSVVAMESVSRKRVDVSGFVSDGVLKWPVPAGKWKLMMFVCVKDGDPNVDYLDPGAVKRYVAMTHQQYYDRFKDHFGTTINGAFFDETTLYRAKGRIWTSEFNEKFKAKHGFDPALYYPALWEDIGAETQAARNYLFGFRSELYATGYPKVVEDWCTQHGIRSTGHQDQEEVVNPVCVSGDLMKCFKYQGVPGIDKIGGNRPAERFYKVVSSAAYNWDKPLVMSETYGAMGDISWDELYRVAMEQYTKGINQLIPHAVWYDDSKVTFKPELSWRHPKYAEGLKGFNRYLSRLNLMLQNDGRHVADVAVLYPIATMQAGTVLDGPLGHYNGGVEISEADYVDVGVMLTDQLGRDFTYLHPEVLVENCVVEGSSLKLSNRTNHESYQILVIPGHRVIGWSSLRKIKEFHDQGGTVVATGDLPDHSAEFGHDADVVRVVRELFPEGDPGASSVWCRNGKGGITVRLRKLDGLREVFSQLNARLQPDVGFAAGEVLRYIHKIHQGRHVYFFANCGQQRFDVPVALRGNLRVRLWDPHDGRISDPLVSAAVHHASGVSTKVPLQLAPGRSVFVVAPVEK